MSLRLISATLAFVVGFPLLSLAGPIIDFTTLGGAPPTAYLDSPQTYTAPLGSGDITATAYVLNGTVWDVTKLTVRNDSPDDHGLGICSEGVDHCDGDGGSPGDINENRS